MSPHIKFILFFIIGTVLGFVLAFQYRNDSQMAETMSQMSAHLTHLSGDDFDQAFLSEMIIHHEGAIDMANIVLEKSSRPELLDLANKIIQAQSQEIRQMKQWENAWFNK